MMFFSIFLKYFSLFCQFYPMSSSNKKLHPYFFFNLF